MILSTRSRCWCAVLLILAAGMLPPAAAGAGEPSAPPASPVSDTPETVDQATLTPTQASFSASLDKGIAINGTAVRTLEQQSDGSWLYRFDVDSFIAEIKESLVFRWENNQVIPLQYRYELSGFMIPNRERAINYDWEQKTVSGHFRKKRFSFDLEEKVMDPLGFQLQLMQDIKAGKTTMQYKIIDKGRVDEDKFAIIGEEMTETRLGRVKTIMAEKVRGPDSKRETLMWFAPELDYLLVKLVQVESDGTRYEINIEDADIRNQDSDR